MCSANITHVHRLFSVIPWILDKSTYKLYFFNKYDFLSKYFIIYALCRQDLLTYSTNFQMAKNRKFFAFWMYGSSSEDICRWWCGRPSLPAIRTRCPSTCPGRTPATSPSSPWTFALFRSQRKRWLLFSAWLDGQFPRYNFLRQSVFVWVLNSLSFEDNLHSLNNNYSIQNYNLASSQVFVGWRRWKTKHLPKPVPTYCLLEVIF